MFKLSGKHYGYLVTMLSAVCFGTGAIIIKIAYSMNLTAWQFLVMQNLCAVPLLLVIYALSPGKNWHNLRQKMIKLAILGIFGTLGTSVTVFLAFEHIEAGVGTVLFYTYPAFVSLGSLFFFQEKLRLTHYFCLVATVLGALCTINIWSLNVAALPLKGILFIYLSALAYTFFNLYSQHNLAESSALEVTTFTQLFATLVLIIIKPPFFLLQGVSREGLILGFAMALLTTVFSFLLLLKGITLIGASKASIVSTFELPVTLTLAFLILHEDLNPGKVIGATMILASIIYLNYSDTKKVSCRQAATEQNLFPYG